MSSGEDRSALDSACRYLLPYPIASLYRLAHASHEPSARYANSHRLAEGIFRFLGLISLADATASGATAKQLKGWMRKTVNPGMGKWLGLFTSTQEFLSETQDGPFLVEARQIWPTGSTWEAAADAIRQIRNRWAHDEVHVSNKEAGPLLKELKPLLGDVLSGISFLDRYALGSVQGLRASGDGRFTYYWYASRGLEELGEPVRLEAGAPITDDLMLLLGPRRETALYLAPFFHWGLTEGDRAAHVLWLHGLEEGGGGARQARYRHPVLRQSALQGFVDPSDTDGDGVEPDSFPAEAGRYPGRIRLRLDDTARKRLADPLRRRKLHDRYEVVGKLGEGGMGVVWHVHDTVLDRPCAFKQLRAIDPRSVRRFAREGQLLASVHHPGVVDVYDTGLGPDLSPYLVMELVEGEDLQALVEREGALPLDEAVGIILSALESLEAVHDAGVVHRDVKPSNFIRSGDLVRVVDFGIARGSDDTRLTRTIDQLGSPAFMAPEQMTGEATVRSDVYAMGRLLFVLLAGRLPRPGEALRKAASDVPREIDQVYDRATSLDPGGRYDSARALAEAISAGLELAREGDRGGDRPRRRRLGEGAVLGLLGRVAEGFPQPIARFAYRLSWSWDDGPGSSYGLVQLASTCIEYLGLCDLARWTLEAPPGAGGFGMNLGRLDRPTLGDFANIHRQYQRHTGRVRGRDQTLSRIVRARNELAHGAAPSAGLPAGLVEGVVELLEELAFLEDEQLLAVTETAVDRGGPRSTVVDLRGAYPAMTRRWVEGAHARGLYLRDGEALVALEPFMLISDDRPPEVLVYHSQRQEQIAYRKGEERIVRRDPDLTERLQSIIGVGR